ncbi:hypothetical protein OROHE_012509 [Orobanche hederae]
MGKSRAPAVRVGSHMLHGGDGEWQKIVEATKNRGSTKRELRKTEIRRGFQEQANGAAAAALEYFNNKEAMLYDFRLNLFPVIILGEYEGSFLEGGFADKQTDEIYAQMSLQPVHFERDVFPIPYFGLKPSKRPTAFFYKTLTARDTGMHSGFYVPWRAAEKLFRQSDYKMQPLTQELIVRDLHNNTWTFRHIYRVVGEVFGSRLGLPKLVSFVLAGNFLFAASNNSQIAIPKEILNTSFFLAIKIPGFLLHLPLCCSFILIGGI